MIKEKIIPALDVQTISEFDFLVKELRGEAITVKVGMELYYTFGNRIIEKLKDNNFKIFLDLKMHDIPNTVHKAAKTLARNGVDILNVHAAGGTDMMRAALEGFKSENEKGILIGVTQLTSTSKTMMNTELEIPGEVDDIVLNYAKLVHSSGLDGIVCSAHEVKKIKLNINQDFKCITPGIRPKGLSSHDQKRVMTPLEAINQGSDFLVIGRAITQVKSPKLAFQNIIKEIKNESNC